MDISEMGTVVEGALWPGDEKGPEKTTQTCSNCGTHVEFVKGQWRRPCPKCKLVITVRRLRVRRAPRINCFACFDRGLIVYEAQDDGNIYDYGVRCTCRAGEARREKGVPFLNQAGNAPSYELLFARNKLKYEQSHGGKEVAAL